MVLARVPHKFGLTRPLGVWKRLFFEKKTDISKRTNGGDEEVPTPEV